MSHADCGTIRELIPGFVGSRLSSGEIEDIERHLSGCAECRDELELAQMLFASPARVPEGLADRVIEAVRADRRPVHRPWWGISAAAVAALALGIGIMSDPSVSVTDVPDFASEIEEGELWMSDDGLLAGAPSLEGLSDEALLQLLEELSATEGAA